MKKPDLDAIRARWAKRRGARTDVPVLLQYIETLEHMLAEERENVDNLQDMVDDLERRFVYGSEQTGLANRIRRAEARFVEEYDLRKAAERQVEILEANRNDETLDGTDAAHPAWWRGNDAGVRGTVNAVHKMLANAIPDSGAFGAWELNDLHARIKSMLAEIEELKARIVTLEAMR